jgi:hypothetical protein
MNRIPLLHPTQVELLEDHCTPAVFNVTGSGDGLFPVKHTGPHGFSTPTLRSAIDAPNASARIEN